MKEGDVVLVYLKKPVPATVEGTYIGMTHDKQVQVLLSDGIIFTGNHYEIKEKD